MWESCVEDLKLGTYIIRRVAGWFRIKIISCIFFFFFKAVKLSAIIFSRKYIDHKRATAFKALEGESESFIFTTIIQNLLAQFAFDEIQKNKIRFVVGRKTRIYFKTLAGINLIEPRQTITVSKISIYRNDRTPRQYFMWMRLKRNYAKCGFALSKRTMKAL